MKKVQLIVFIIITYLNTIASIKGLDAEKLAVQKVIRTGYIEGVFLKGDANLIRAHWHEAGDIIYFEPKSRTIMKGSAVEYFEGYFQKKPGPFNVDISYEFKDIHISDYAATAIVEIFNKDRSKQIYTDYLSLYKFDTGWKIVSKTYYAFPKK